MSWPIRVGLQNAYVGINGVDGWRAFDGRLEWRDDPFIDELVSSGDPKRPAIKTLLTTLTPGDVDGFFTGSCLGAYPQGYVPKHVYHCVSKAVLTPGSMQYSRMRPLRRIEKETSCQVDAPII